MEPVLRRNDGPTVITLRFIPAFVFGMEFWELSFVNYFRDISAVFVFLFLAAAGFSDDGSVSVATYPSIHDAVKANPGRMLYVPSGEYRIDEKIRFDADHSGLYGPGRIVQTNPESPIIEIEHAENVVLRDITLTRPEGKMETDVEGILAADCRELRIENVRILDNRTRSAALSLRDCDGARIENCLVRNYMKIAVDDRTAGPNYGYAFRCIDGTGISVRACTGTVIRGNRVIEKNLLPTPEIKEKYGLGIFVKKNAEKGKIIAQKTWDEEYVNNWHQGSAIIVTSPEKSDRTQILDNTIENAAQGIDLHCDHVILSGNIVDNAFIGMKAMHGSRNILILGNQFIRNDLWSIGLMPGAPSRAAGFEDNPNANVDGGSVIANNIVSDFGYGNAHWIWGDDGVPFKFDTGQLPHNPPLSDVVVSGNILYDPGREAGRKDVPPRYRYAVVVPQGPDGPRNLRFSNNIFPPGRSGISNAEFDSN